MLLYSLAYTRMCGFVWCGRNMNIKYACNHIALYIYLRTKREDLVTILKYNFKLNHDFNTKMYRRWWVPSIIWKMFNAFRTYLFNLRLKLWIVRMEISGKAMSGWIVTELDMCEVIWKQYFEINIVFSQLGCLYAHSNVCVQTCVAGCEQYYLISNILFNLVKRI